SLAAPPLPAPRPLPPRTRRRQHEPQRPLRQVRVDHQDAGAIAGAGHRAGGAAQAFVDRLPRRFHDLAELRFRLPIDLADARAGQDVVELVAQEQPPRSSQVEGLVFPPLPGSADRQSRSKSASTRVKASSGSAGNAASSRTSSSMSAVGPPPPSP